MAIFKLQATFEIRAATDKEARFFLRHSLGYMLDVANTENINAVWVSNRDIDDPERGIDSVKIFPKL